MKVSFAESTDGSIPTWKETRERAHHRGNQRPLLRKWLCTIYPKVLQKCCLTLPKYCSTTFEDTGAICKTNRDLEGAWVREREERREREREREKREREEDSRKVLKSPTPFFSLCFRCVLRDLSHSTIPYLPPRAFSGTGKTIGQL